MKTDVKVAAIGGGIVGASVLYWLGKMGWSDAVFPAACQVEPDVSSRRSNRSESVHPNFASQ